MPVDQRSVVFEDQRPTTAVHPNRTDVACFIGYVGVRAGVQAGRLPPPVEDDLRQAGWLGSAYDRAGARQLLDVPVNIESWDRFNTLFAWDERPIRGSATKAATYLGAAVRSFFGEGGRQCVVVRMGDPAEIGSPPDDGAISALIPGYPFLLSASPSDRRTWSGFGHLAGLPEVSFVALPDLPELCSEVPPERIPRTVKVEKKEAWVEWAPEMEEVRPPQLLDYRAPYSGQAGYARWSLALSFALRYLARQRRDVQLVASLPRPLVHAGIADLFAFLAAPNQSGILASGLEVQRNGIATAFLQLVYPWVRTRWSSDLPEGAEPSDGTLIGQLARNALTEGTFRSAARLAPRGIVDLAPALTIQERLATQEKVAFQDRVSVYGLTPQGIRLLTDNTAAPDANYRPAAVNRFVSALVRAARGAGEESVFENSGETLWAEIQGRIAGLMRRFFELGALRGDGAEEAYSVRCDRSTMTQNDIDNGRVVVEVQFQAAFPVEKIKVLLALQDGGRLTPAADGRGA